MLNDLLLNDGYLDRGQLRARGFRRMPNETEKMFMTGDLWMQYTRTEATSAEGKEKDWDDGLDIFFRLNDNDRLLLIFDLMLAWQCLLPINRSMVIGALRLAWECEPYFGGARLGSYVSAILHDQSFEVDWNLDDFAYEWGPSLMSAAESERLEELTYPVTVYRGGVGRANDVAHGVSWTLDYAIASFYAKEWPRRWGVKRRPVILSMTVERKDVAAFLNSRKEAEILIPDAYQLRPSRCPPITAGAKASPAKKAQINRAR